MRLLWMGLAWRSRPIPAENAARSCLILAPHPDDETLGCGGLILWKGAAGARVDVLLAADGGASHAHAPTRCLTRPALVALRRTELLAACAQLGLPAERVHALDLPDGALSSHRPALEAGIAAAVAALAPAEVYVCAAQDGHRDHRALAEATASVLAALPPASRPRLFHYPVWMWAYASWRRPGLGNAAALAGAVRAMGRLVATQPVVRLDLGDRRRVKRAALDEHRSQLGRLPEEPDWKGLPEPFVATFFRRAELFFPVEPTPARRAAADPAPGSASGQAARASGLTAGQSSLEGRAGS
jgi:LmbE family N-acetylglucosaminyl deacetylase